MGTKIEWTQKTWNPIAGCTPVSPGCLNCYAATMAHRLEAMGQEKYNGLTVLRNGRWVFNGKIRLNSEALALPLKWRKPRRIFVNSMSDLFHPDVPFEFINQVFAVMAICPKHTFQVLTKRPERMAEYFKTTMWGDVIVSLRDEDSTDRVVKELTNRVNLDGVWGGTRPDCFGRHQRSEGVKKLLPDQWPLPNVWLGTSCEDQARADERIPHLLGCPAAVRFLSCEPLLGPVDLLIDGERSAWHCPNCGSTSVDPEGSGGGDDVTTWSCPSCNQVGSGEDADWKSLIHWVIVGGESGPRARPCDVECIRSVVAQCKAASVPVFVKQAGAMVEVRNDRVSEWGRGGDVLTAVDGYRGYQGEHMLYRLEDPKGGDPSEWPEDLRVREWPEVRK